MIKNSNKTIDLGPHITSLMISGDYSSARSLLRNIHKKYPKHAPTIQQYAICELKSGDYQKAIELFIEARRLSPDNFKLLEGMGEAYGLLGKIAESASCGTECLKMKANLVIDSPQTRIPKHPPPAFSDDRSRNIISFSLYGDNPKYCETSILNVEYANKLFPNWKCRFYIDDTVPKLVINRLIVKGAEVISVPDDIRRAVSPLMWRFLVIDDNSVDRFMIRDADSILSIREKVAVDEWIGSDKWFHSMRDFFTHHELLLAGMWGGCVGVLSGTFESMSNFYLSFEMTPNNVDQLFLREIIWPTARQSILTHDSVFSFNDSVRFPSHEELNLGKDFHVGSNVGNGYISGEVKLGDNRTKATWRVVDENAHEVCRYESEIVNGKWKAGIPGFYINEIQSGKWKFEVIA